MVSFFRSYDLRGKYPEEISREEAEKVGKAYGTFIETEKVLVGRDGREHGEKIAEAFVNGVTSTGTDVLYAGKVPTPVVYFGQVKEGLDSSAVVTASHNPSEYTGFKFAKKNALAMSREGGMNDIEDLYVSEDFETGEGERSEVELEEDYIEAVKDRIELEQELEVAVNFGNGVAGPIGEKMLEALGCEVDAVNMEIDGSFPNHLPDPTKEEAKDALRPHMEGKDLGIIFDGDGDRAGFLLPKSGCIGEDELIALLAEEVLEDVKGKVAYDLRSSQLVPEKIDEYGGEPVECRVGHTFVSEKIHEDPEIVFAGELSGHFYFPAFDLVWDDGLFAAALMCKLVSEVNIEEKLEDLPDYPVSPELRIDCPEEAKQEVMREVKEEYSDHEVSTKDGIKIEFEGGWALVRPSGTEEKMSLRCEADTEEELENIRSEVEERVRSAILEHQ